MSSFSVLSGFLDNGEPTSVTFIGKLYQEDKLLAVAKAYQDATGHHLKRPRLGGAIGTKEGASPD
jgi:Asp-tRNA(Asn)/Glu-tRNA(Gln) amidotransferase A subunit family amidase